MAWTGRETVTTLLAPLDVTLVNFKLDPVSNNVVLDQAPLQRHLQRLKEYIQDTTTRGFVDIRMEIDTQVSDAKRQLQVAIAEATQALEDKFAPKSAIHEIEELAGNASARSLQVEAKQTRLQERVNAAVSQAEKAAAGIDSIARSMDVEVSTLEVANSPRSNLASGGGMGADFAAQQKELQSLKGDISQCERQLDRLDDKLRAELASIGHRLDEFDNIARAQGQRVEAQGERLRALEADIQTFTAEARALCEELRRTKADAAVLTDLEDQIKQVHELVNQVAHTDVLESRIGSLERRAGVLERRAGSVEGIAKEVQEDSQALRQGLSDAGLRINRCAEQAAELGREVEVRFRERCSLLEQRDEATVQRVRGAEAQLEDHQRLLEGLSGKAAAEEVAALRGAVCTLAEDMKDKEQAVLFGARCLSCNRVFDDVQPEAGAVNIRGEKQRAQVLADIQRALHTPRTDPSQSIKLLAVKVGRPANLQCSSGLGPFEGRDASSLAWSAEDVALLPVRGGAVPGSNERPRDTAPATARPSTSGSSGPAAALLQPRRPATTPGAVAEGERRSASGSGSRESKRNADGRSTLAALRGPREGPMDFKHPLSQLVGRH